MNHFFLNRFALSDLKAWKTQATPRKPLVLRGARQVGKSWLVRQLAKESFENLVELNFEENPLLADLFKNKTPAEALSLIEIETKQAIHPDKTLLFLDEIQAAPEVFLKLRYFFEQIPALHVIAAGSLLEFLLEGNCSPVIARPRAQRRAEAIQSRCLDCHAALRAARNDGGTSSYIKTMQKKGTFLSGRKGDISI